MVSPTHHISNNKGTNISEGETGSNYVISKQRESGYIFPSFIVKSNSVGAKTASYTITYEMYEPGKDKIADGSKRFNNVVFSNYMDGESYRFPAISGGLDKNSYYIVKLTLHNIS